MRSWIIIRYFHVLSHNTFWFLSGIQQLHNNSICYWIFCSRPIFQHIRSKGHESNAEGKMKAVDQRLCAIFKVVILLKISIISLFGCYNAHWAFYYTMVHKKWKNLKKSHFLQSRTKIHSSNLNKICKILIHRGMVCSCVLNLFSPVCSI